MKNNYSMELFIHILLITLIAGILIAMAVDLAFAGVNTTKVVVHHTESHDASAAEIRRWHVEGNGWDDIGYHYIIRADGKIEPGRPVNVTGAHAKGRNDYLGVALTGRDTFAAEQIESLKALLRDYNVNTLERHHEECPGPGLDVEGIKEELSI